MLHSKLAHEQGRLLGGTYEDPWAGRAALRETTHMASVTQAHHVTAQCTHRPGSQGPEQAADAIAPAPYRPAAQIVHPVDPPALYQPTLQVLQSATTAPPVVDRFVPAGQGTAVTLDDPAGQ
jgi:hypothetical protein